YFRFEEYQQDKKYQEKLSKCIESFEDGLSQKYFSIILESVLQGKALREITKVYSGEKQYFLSCFKGKLENLNILDAGAYTGDTVKEIMAEGIRPMAVYCFEANVGNFAGLKEYCAGVSGQVDVHAENLALWDSKTVLGMKFENYNARMDAGSDENKVNTMTIDEYFKDIKLGFVKMDIEGAEKRALMGGLKTIKRDRPILAISIYHSLEDVVDIPEMLLSELPGYSFFVRCHSYTYSEAVLYGIPGELGIRLEQEGI
ncbi:MAG: FkbM family methyltransferase, partial [Roseburia sp.]|nr:FkbM family methyltransferase [Roseburia sp.]